MRTCTICGHAQKEAINKALLSGQSERAIAGQFRVSKSAAARHRAHIAEEVAQSKQLSVERLLNDLDGLQRRAEQQLTRAEKTHDLRGALLAIGEGRRLLETALKLLMAGDVAERVERLEKAVEERGWKRYGR
mgnify:FL=1